MSTPRRSRRLAALERCQDKYETLKSQLDQLGYVMQGSVIERTKQCGQPNCRCHLGPEHEHGPYYQWTRKVKAKTVTKLLSPAEARVYQDCIRNGRKLKKLVARMYELSAQAARYLAEDEPQT